MLACCSSSHVLAPALLSVTRVAPRRVFPLSSHHHLSSSTSSTLLPALDVFLPASDSSPQAYLRQRKFKDLKGSLTWDSSPSRVWADYTDLLHVMGYERLPLEVHKQVLRRCTPPSNELRAIAARRLTLGTAPSSAHVHEDRFRAVIRNMRASDFSPGLDDYHFILEQFAAVGHCVGAMYVYKEISEANIMPRPKTFGLCLQAIAYRLTLPVPKKLVEFRAEQTRKMMWDLIGEMRRLRIAFTAANLDLTIRILKDTLDMDAFEELMKWGYGIDLSNPDCPPLEPSSSHIKSDLGLEVPARTYPPPQRFSTAALNTTIEILGHIGDVSKLVQAFEVLTQPLPRASQHKFSSFDDDDDFVAADSSQAPVYVAPHTQPNTTSYIMLIRHLCTIGHATLARHYLNEAMFYNRASEAKTKSQISRGCKEITAPTIAVNRGTFLPLLGLGNRTKNLALTRWLTRKLPRVLRLKRSDLRYYTKYKAITEKRMVQEQEWEAAKAAGRYFSLEEKWLAQKQELLAEEELLAQEHELLEQLLSSEEDLDDAEQPRSNKPVPPIQEEMGAEGLPGQENSAKEFPASPADSLAKQWPTGEFTSLIERSRRNRPQEISIFDVDIDALPEPTPIIKRTRILDIDLHIRVLERDIAELEDFWRYLEHILHRNIQRVKEGLGRRVWAGKDIYLAHEDRRRQVSREDWVKNVNFRTGVTSDNPFNRTPAMIPAAPTHRSFSTFFHNNQTMQTEAPTSDVLQLTSLPRRR